jgi:hypothetical protein
LLVFSQTVLQDTRFNHQDMGYHINYKLLAKVIKNTIILWSLKWDVAYLKLIYEYL